MDSFKLLYKHAEHVNAILVWLPVCILPLVIAACLFWHSRCSSNTRIAALCYLSAAIGIPVSFAYGFDPAPQLRHTRRTRNSDSEIILFPETFSSYYLVYPVMQALFVLLAILGVSLKTKAKMRYMLHICFACLGLGAAYLQANVKDVLEKNNRPRPDHSVIVVFLDQIFIAVLTSLALFSAALVKSNEDRIRLIQGSLMLYDIYKLCSIDNFDMELVLPHCFATPILLILNAVQLQTEEPTKAESGSPVRPVQQFMVIPLPSNYPTAPVQPQPIPALAFIPV